MKNQVSRRQMIWAAPVVAAAIAAPSAAASERGQGTAVFNSASAWLSGNGDTISWTYSARNATGPGSATGITAQVRIDGKLVQTRQWPSLSGWSSTETVNGDSGHLTKGNHTIEWILTVGATVQERREQTVYVPGSW